jgi:hypothetical protein
MFPGRSGAIGADIVPATLFQRSGETGVPPFRQPRVQADERKEDRGIVEALGRAQSAQEIRSLSHGAVDVAVLRAGKKTSETERDRLGRAKGKLKRQFGKA